MREIVTSEFRDYADGKKTKVDGGMESVTDIEWKLEDNILFTSNLQLFSAFRKMDEVIVRNGNTVAMKVNKYITVNFNVQLINEKAVTPRTQVLESLAVGLSYTLL